MKHNFQVERFDDKDQRDARYHELRNGTNPDGTIGRRGLVKLSVGEWMTVKDLARRLGDGKEIVVDRDITVPVWAVAYPREIPGRKRRRLTTFSARPFQSKRVKRSRFFRRHPGETGKHWITGRPIQALP